MAKLKVGDRVKVKDRPGWPGGYKIANWEGEIVKVKDDAYKVLTFEHEIVYAP